MSIRIGIVIPVYKAEAFIARTLDSIRTQTFSNWHCVIVDDGSPDNSAALIEPYTQRDPRFTLLRQKNTGVSRARDHGFAQLPADVSHVTFMDADDTYHPFAFAALVEAIEKDSAAIGAHGIGEYIDTEDRPFAPGIFEAMGRERAGFKDGRIIDWPEDAPTCFETLAFVGTVFPPGLILARREVYEKVGPWDPDLIVNQDWDMAVRIARLGHLAYLPRVILGYRRHPNNVSGNIDRFNREAQRMFRKTFFAPENSPAQRAMLRQGWRAWQIYRGAQKAAAFRGSLKSLRIADAARSGAHLLAHAVRYARGYPTVSGW